MDEMESICFQIISNAGTARSLLIEALQEAREGNFPEVENKLNEANEYFVQAHKVHAELIQKEAQGEGVPFSLLFMHAEDQLMSTETIKHMAKEMIHLYNKIEG
ncbi:PTS lactose/cellobiose transporter subunit IIA [Virgibacillus dakarensis]|uniref:PTS lactose/cellobiose transporter subunit IIA n=1 Tax=Virgibacillus dakarensis TaxID=1917889 RepID=UPI000B42F3DE|nr:PTS lactose/cellobiose transporter subunit IIA [Virgibacillus dakarensis]MTW86823.1 PTS lactose/cellobiose transporter subunit IIA [Virgibacillus dakarensis]